MENTENREIPITKIFKVPLDLMWEVWTDPAHLVHWWGPNGFTSTIHKMDFQKGGEWKLTLRGPDGTNYPNRSVFKEIVPLKKIVFEHFDPYFFTTVLFGSMAKGPKWTGRCYSIRWKCVKPWSKCTKRTRDKNSTLKNLKNIFPNCPTAPILNKIAANIQTWYGRYGPSATPYLFKDGNV
jgi:uncharacterized protein YndB with AHSA1/START domain